MPKALNGQAWTRYVWPMSGNPANRPCGPATGWVFSARPGRADAGGGGRIRGAGLTPAARRGLLAAAAGLALPLLLAGWLVPDPRGMGTHEQLGLPACGFYTRFGVRCPTCGMTTAWAHMVRGQVGPALRASAAGSLLAVVDAAGAAWLLVCAMWGRWWPAPLRPTTMAWIAGTAVAAALGEWAVRLVGHLVCSSGNL